MTKCTPPRIGLVADTEQHSQILIRLLSLSSCELAASLSSANLADYLANSAAAATIDLWLLETGSSHIQSVLDLLMDSTDQPLLVVDQIPPIEDQDAHHAWQQRVLGKLQIITARMDVPAEQHDHPVPDNIWVLAASMGGPEAVQSFFSALPAGLPVAWVYGQHIQTSFESLLASTFKKQPHYRAKLLKNNNFLTTGSIGIVPPDQQLRFLPQGHIVDLGKPWEGLYQPNLDQVIAELARIYRHKLGVIIFSGLCNDGAVGCRVASACGASVWAQSPESCLNSAMPDAAIATGCVSYQGSPEQLAHALAEKIGQTADPTCSAAPIGEKPAMTSIVR